MGIIHDTREIQTLAFPGEAYFSVGSLGVTSIVARGTSYRELLFNADKAIK